MDRRGPIECERHPAPRGLRHRRLRRGPRCGQSGYRDGERSHRSDRVVPSRHGVGDHHGESEWGGQGAALGPGAGWIEFLRYLAELGTLKSRSERCEVTREMADQARHSVSRYWEKPFSLTAPPDWDPEAQELSALGGRVGMPEEESVDAQEPEGRTQDFAGTSQRRVEGPGGDVMGGHQV